MLIAKLIVLFSGVSSVYSQVTRVDEDVSSSTRIDLGASSSSTTAILTSTSIAEDSTSSSTTSISASVSTSSPTVSSTQSRNGTAASATFAEETELPMGGPHLEIPPARYSQEVLDDLTALELEVYANAVQDGDLPSDDSGGPPKVVLPACPNVKAAVGRRQSNLPINTRSYGCAARSFEVDLYVHYVSNADPGGDVNLPAGLVQRVRNNVDLLISMFAAKFIVIRWKGSIITDQSDKRFHEHNSDDNDYNQAYMAKTRLGGPSALNIWLVGKVFETNGNTFPGYAWRPTTPIAAYDGIVIREGSLSPSTEKPLDIDDYDKTCSGIGVGGGTMVHEVGHWFGLRHTFGDTSCATTGYGDGFPDTNHYPKDENDGCCFQNECFTNVRRRVQNWMSYSKCRGTTRGSDLTNPQPLKLNYQSFSADQKAAMFSNFLTIRQGLKCPKPKTSARSLPFSPHRFSKRDTKSAEILADLLLRNCSVAIQDVYAADTLPLAPSFLQSVSSVAKVLQATPPPVDSANPRPATVTAQPGSGSGGGSTGVEVFPTSTAVFETFATNSAGVTISTGTVTTTAMGTRTRTSASSTATSNGATGRVDEIKSHSSLFSILGCVAGLFFF